MQTQYFTYALEVEKTDSITQVSCIARAAAQYVRMVNDMWHIEIDIREASSMRFCRFSGVFVL